MNWVGRFCLCFTCGTDALADAAKCKAAAALPSEAPAPTTQAPPPPRPRASPPHPRDEILHIMHRNRIPEVKGTFMEEWHQKLHNNTTPDDVPICAAYLAFLESDGDEGRYWRVLSDNGITRERLESFDRPIVSRPQFWKEKKARARPWGSGGRSGRAGGLCWGRAAGFQEWAARCSPVPECASLGSGALGSAAKEYRRTRVGLHARPSVRYRRVRRALS